MKYDINKAVLVFVVVLIRGKLWVLRECLLGEFM